MLMCGIINKLNVDLDKDTTRPFSFFFCEATDAQRSNTTSVLRGLICHLIDQDHLLMTHVRKEHGRWGGKQFKDKNAWEVMKRILVAILNDERLSEVTLPSTHSTSVLLTEPSCLISSRMNPSYPALDGLFPAGIRGSLRSRSTG